MPINLQGSGNIAEGWGPAPQLHAPDLGGLVATILRDRLMREKMTQENIGETIKNVRDERQGNALLESMKAQGLLPEGYDAGGLGGAKLGVGLAKMIQDQKEFQALQEHRRAMETRVGGRGGRGSRGDGGVTPEVPDNYYGLSVAPGQGGGGPEIIERDGIKYQVVKTKNGVRYNRVPYQTGKGTAGEKPTNVGTAVKERLRLIEETGEDKKDIAKEEAQNIKDLKPNVPFSRSDEYNLRVNRLKQLEAVPGMPLTEPAVPQKAPADKAGGHAEGYGMPPVGTERGGYRFKGGDPKDPNSWEKI